MAAAHSRVVQRVIREELGRDACDLFSSFDAEPFASASIGQVHDAVLHDGRPVAVKVQRPGIGELLMCDIALMRSVAAIVDRTRVLGATRTRHVVDELARWTRESSITPSRPPAALAAPVREH